MAKRVKSSIESLPQELQSLSPAQMEAEAERISEAAEKLQTALKAKAKAERLQADLSPEREAPAQDAPGEIFTPSPTIGSAKLDQVLSELNGEGCFEVFRVEGNTDSKVGIFAIAEWPEQIELIAKEYGGGTFKIRFKDSEGHYAAQMTRTFDKKAYGGAVMPAQNGGGDLSAFVKVMMERESAHQREMMSLMQQSHQATLEAIKASSAPRESGLSKAIEEAMVKKLLAEDKSDKKSFMEEAQGMLETLALFRESIPTAEPQHPLHLAISEAIKLAKPLIEVGLKRLANPVPTGSLVPKVPALPGKTGTSVPVPASVSPTSAVPVVPAKDSPVPVDSPTPTKAGEDPMPTAETLSLKGYAKDLLQVAVMGAKPEAIAGFIYQQTPEDKLDELEQSVNDPQIVGKLGSVEPRLVPYQAWLTELFKELALLLQEDPADGNDNGDGPEAENGSQETATATETAPASVEAVPVEAVPVEAVPVEGATA
jgi:hypothetical protein